MFILKIGHQPGVYVPLRALFLVINRSAITHCRDIFKLERQAPKTSEEHKNVVN